MQFLVGRESLFSLGRRKITAKSSVLRVASMPGSGIARERRACDWCGYGWRRSENTVIHAIRAIPVNTVNSVRTTPIAMECKVWADIYLFWISAACRYPSTESKNVLCLEIVDERQVEMLYRHVHIPPPRANSFSRSILFHARDASKTRSVHSTLNHFHVHFWDTHRSY